MERITALRDRLELAAAAARTAARGEQGDQPEATLRELTELVQDRLGADLVEIVPARGRDSPEHVTHDHVTHDHDDPHGDTRGSDGVRREHAEPARDDLLSRVIASGRVYTAGMDDAAALRPGMHGGLFVPMVHRGDVCGVLAVENRERWRPTSADLAVLDVVAAQAAVVADVAGVADPGRAAEPDPPPTPDEATRTFVHDLRGSLSGIVAAAEILVEDDDDDTRSTLAAIIMTQAERISEMLQHMPPREATPCPEPGSRG